MHDQLSAITQFCADCDFGSMIKGNSELRYEVVPGSGTGELDALAGEVHLRVIDGVHEVTVHLRDV